MTDLTELLTDWVRRMDEDAARALARIPADRAAGVLVTPVLVSPLIDEGRPVELEPVAYFRPREGPRVPLSGVTSIAFDGGPSRPVTAAYLTPVLEPYPPEVTDG